MKFIKLILLFTLLFNTAFAQMPDAPTESANILRQNGQIYLVVLVLVTIFAGIIFMLTRIEKKINHLENNQKK